jgi:anti-anti-sigma factor
MPERLDVTNAQRLLETVRPLLRDGHGPVALDFARTEAIDSTALGAIVHLRKGHEARIVLVHVGEPVLRVLVITCLDSLLPRYATVEQLTATIGSVG